jgi:hypothetical protein
MSKLNKSISWKLLFPIGIVLSVIGYFGQGNFLLTTVGFLGNILFWIGLLGWIAYLALMVTEKFKKNTAHEVSSPDTARSSWFRDNWFKIGVLVLLACFIGVYAYMEYQAQKPKTLNEAAQRELYRRLNK